MKRLHFAGAERKKTRERQEKTSERRENTPGTEKKKSRAAGVAWKEALYLLE